VFLKSLTLKGFKSFADKTTLEFEPGVCVVVGPNGSGKSNIVDSVAWVLGAQGARALRGGKMDDVIFAGTSDRPALGRAEVSLTIDNTAGLLPIEFSEVTITRMLFRTGDSEYMINGAPCRLLDIQDLLSDTGIGRQQHVIVGQGQLDAVLNARPEDRRAIIEEAAGILKFRKRKEKAQRRLEATEGNLLRLTDLLREVRRQLRPLERQADAARRHDGLVAELRAIRLHLAGRDIAQLRTRGERRTEARRDLAQREQDVRVRLHGLDAQVLDAERALAIPGDDDVADLLARTEALRERARGLTNLIAERRRSFDRELAAVADEGVVESLVAEAATLRTQLLTVDADMERLTHARDEVVSAEAHVRDLERALDQPDATARFRDAQRTLRQLDDRRRGLARDLAGTRERLAAVTHEQAALEPRAGEADAAERAVAELRAEVDASAFVAPDMTPTARARRAAEEALHDADAEFHAAESESSRCRARAETLAMAVAAAHAAAGSDTITGIEGVVGPLIDHLTIEAGAELAVAAALSEALHAIVVDGHASARVVIDQLKRADAGALLLVAALGSNGAQTTLSVPGTRPLASCVRGSRPGLDDVLARLLSRFVLVDGDWRGALDVALADPGVVAVTRAGDRFGGPGPWRAGPPSSSAVTPGAVAEAEAEAGAADEACSRAARRVEQARQSLADARRAELRATEQDRERRRQLDQLVARATELRRAVEVDGASLAERFATLERQGAELDRELEAIPQLEADARARLAEAERAHEEAQTRSTDVDRARAHALGLRRDLDVKTAAVEERRALLTARLTEIDGRLAARPDEEAKARARRSQLDAKRVAIDEIAERLSTRAYTVEALADRLRERRREQSEAARAAGRRLDALRSERAEAEQQQSDLREQANKLEIEEAEIRLRLEQAVDNIRHEFDCEPDAAVASPAPDVPDGMTLPGRARELERELRLMGPINPLALSEYEALLERHEFLQSQLDDVKNTRRELTRVIKAVDEEIVRVFETAFADVARHFAELFAMLFPGGSGRLVLTQPENLLDTGIEMEARPSGKTVRRLSLLSGGERSLTALAYLFAVFRARPSPFYLMDEVEAALDDVNLHRFLDLLHEFRSEAQLLIVSHQKRTMEAADVLYGVSMPPGGSSRVVSQRIRDLELEDV
jgi:chromosome segregation protein